MPRSAPPSVGRSNKAPATLPENAVVKETCQICYGRKADALVNVRGLKTCPFCKRDLLSVDVNKEVNLVFAHHLLFLAFLNVFVSGGFRSSLVSVSSVSNIVH